MLLIPDIGNCKYFQIKKNNSENVTCTNFALGSHASRFWLDPDVVRTPWMVRWTGAGDVTHFALRALI